MPPEQLPLTDRLLNLIQDPIFWITSIFLALIMGIVANYSTRGVDRLISISSTRRRQTLEEKQRQIEQEVQRLLSNPQVRFDLKLDILYYLLYQILSATMMAIIIITTVWVEISSSTTNTAPQETLIKPQTFTTIAYPILALCLTIATGLVIRYGLKMRRALKVLDQFYKEQENTQTPH